MWLRVEEEQALQISHPSILHGVTLKTMITDLLNLQLLTILTCCLSTRKAGMERFMTLSRYPGTTETSWPARWIAVQA